MNIKFGFLAVIEIEPMHFVQDRSLVHVNVGKIWILLWKCSVGFMRVFFLLVLQKEHSIVR